MMTRGVLVLTPFFHPVIGGVESNAERLARYLAGERVGVQVLTKRTSRELPDLDNRDGIVVRRIGPYGERSPSGKWTLVPAALMWLIRHSSDYDVVCVVDYRGIGLAPLTARAVTRRPVVFQAQTTGVLSGENINPALQRFGIATDGRIAKALKSSIGAAYRGADVIAGISHEIEREALTCGLPRERVAYFPNAIDMTRFRPAEPGERDRLRRERDLPADRVICLFVGRLSREKGVTELLEAWRLLPGTWGPASGGPTQATSPMLVLAGPDMTGHAWDAGASGREFVAKHGLEDSVRFVGPGADVARLVRAADLVVQPSHFEALGLSAIEALASGVPVVATAVGGLLEFIVDGKNGRLCAPQNPAALADALRAVLVDPVERQHLASQARPSVVDEYDERIVFGRMRELFERLAGGAPR